MPVMTRRCRPDVVVEAPSFTLLDEAAVAPADDCAGADVRAGRRSLHVLVIDDNRDAADSLAVLVRFWGHNAGVAYDGAAALAMATAELPDVLFIDIGLPKMDGFQLARRLRGKKRFADSLLVAITGWADKPHRSLWEKAFDHYLIKPVDPPALEMLLRDRRQLVRARAGQSTHAPDHSLAEASPCYG